MDTTREKREIAAISSQDLMWQHDPEHYSQFGEMAVRSIRHAAAVTGRKQFERILDFGCGHGRVLRALKLEWPHARFTACDIDHDAADFCAETFGATGAYSASDLQGDFDLVWCGSVFTHLDAPTWLQLFSHLRSVMTERAFFLFTTHGRHYVNQLCSDDVYLGVDSPKLLAGYRRGGFGYVDYPDTTGYGISVSALSWVICQVERFDDLRIRSTSERAWGGQDVIACQKIGLPNRVPN